MLDACKDIPILSNGGANCQTIKGEVVQCVITCEEGYGFAVDQPDTLDSGQSMILTCGLNESSWNSTYLPDCSGMVNFPFFALYQTMIRLIVNVLIVTVTEIPSSVGQDGTVILQGNTSVCDNSTILNEVSFF